MIVFGGYNRSPRNETWVLSLSSAPVWSQLIPSGAPPSPRWRHTAVYDPVHDRMIVFGGLNDSTVFDETWALSLAGTPTWSRLATSGSAPRRAGHSAIYVPERGSMIVFAGVDGISVEGDTWELTLSETPSWTRLDASGTPPSPRAEHAAIYDPPRQRMVLYGGQGGSSLQSDLWGLDLSGAPSWSQIVVDTSPAERVGCSTIFDPIRDRMILFGGNLYGLVYDDTWAMSLTGTPSWSQVDTPDLPPARADHTAIYDPVADRMLVFGGSDGAIYRGETVQLSLTDTQNWSALELPQTRPPAREMATAISDLPHSRMIVFGGVGYSRYNDVWALSLMGAPTWSQVVPVGAPPSERNGQAAVFDALRGRMLVFGGYDSSRRNDTWSLSLSGTPEWSLLTPDGTPPTPRLGQASIYDPVRDRLVIFGGSGPEYTSLNDLWELNLSGKGTWTELEPLGTPPPAGVDFMSIYDPARDRMIMFGGSETWELGFSGSLAWRKLDPSGTPPTPPAEGHTVIYDPLRDRIVVFGGADIPVDDVGRQHSRTYELTLSEPPTWSQLDPCSSPPSGRRQHTAIYDAARDRMLVFGGSDPVRNDTWALNFGGSTALVPAPPPGSGFGIAAVAPNPSRGGVMLAFTLPRDAMIAIDLFDAQGRRVASVARGVLPAGRHEMPWSTRVANGTAPPGIYLVRYRFPGGQQVRRFAVVR